MRSLKETARSAVYFFSDPALEKDLEERFLNNSWVKEVHVSRDSYFASHIKVLVHLRKPCVGVEWENQLYLVDKEGVRVPEEIHPPSEPFLRVRGVRQKPPDLGEIWDDPVILPACKLARFLKKQKVHSWLDLQSIDMGNFEGKESPKEPEISLYTSQGTRICWGRPLESTRIEGDPHIKLKILKQFCERYPALKEIALVDIRFEEESFVLIQQAH